MREPRNPFKMRLSEQIESDATFLRLFSPGFLDILPKDNLWDRIQIFRSAPGGGKTSLFRVFTPSSLITLYASRGNEDYKELYNRMESLGVISENGPNLLGIMLPCARNYATLEDLNFDIGQKERLFYSLLNARLILLMLRGALVLKNLNYPNDLERLEVLEPLHNDLPTQVPVPSSGKDLFEWARNIEKGVCEIIDSFVPTSSDNLQGHDTLHLLSLFKPEYIKCDGKPVANRILVMLDDVHKLTSLQRKKVLSTLFDLRLPVGIWIAERLEALSSSELLGIGVTTGREFEEPINIESFWRSTTNSKRFENAIVNIADRRIKSVNDIQIGLFTGCLQDSLDGIEWQSLFEKAIEVVSDRVRKKVSSTKRYKEWIEINARFEGTPRELAAEWRTHEILIERATRKGQLTLNHDLALMSEDLEEKENSAVRAAAEFFLAREFNIPYYYGISRITALSSSNIEQFLAFAGELFEEIISAALLRNQIILASNRQETILKRITQQRWEEIPRRIPNGRDVQKLLESICQFAFWETNKPNAPYSPGVTGIALSMIDRDKLIDLRTINKNPMYKRLALILSECISHNLLEASLDRRQGQRGKTWMILYLNRWLCLQFGLPLQYGGWRPKKLDELCKWLDQGFRIPKKDERLVKYEYR